MIRTVIYWLFCLLSITLMLVCWNIYSGPPRRFQDLAIDLLHRHAAGFKLRWCCYRS